MRGVEASHSYYATMLKGSSIDILQINGASPMPFHQGSTACNPKKLSNLSTTQPQTPTAKPETQNLKPFPP